MRDAFAPLETCPEAMAVLSTGPMKDRPWSFLPFTMAAVKYLSSIMHESGAAPVPIELTEAAVALNDPTRAPVDSVRTSTVPSGLTVTPAARVELNACQNARTRSTTRSEEHTSELQSLM